MNGCFSLCWEDVQAGVQVCVQWRSVLSSVAVAAACCGQVFIQIKLILAPLLPFLLILCTLLIVVITLTIFILLAAAACASSLLFIQLLCTAAAALLLLVLV